MKLWIIRRSNHLWKSIRNCYSRIEIGWVYSRNGTGNLDMPRLLSDLWQCSSWFGLSMSCTGFGRCPLPRPSLWCLRSCTRVCWRGYERPNRSSFTTNAEWQGWKTAGPEPVKVVTVLRMTRIHIHGTWICLGRVPSSNYSAPSALEPERRPLPVGCWRRRRLIRFAPVRTRPKNSRRASSSARGCSLPETEFASAFTRTRWQCGESRCLRSDRDGCPCRRLRSQFFGLHPSSTDFCAISTRQYCYFHLLT